MTGYKHTEEAKRKISLSKIGKKRKPATDDAIKNMRIAQSSRKPISEESRRKMSLARSGNKSRWWKGGINPINDSIRKSLEYKFWRKKCLSRDNFTCQKTGVSGGKLRVHHINNFADFPELRFDINNGITLSEDSHILFHKIYGVRNNTREQLIEFLNKQ